MSHAPWGGSEELWAQAADCLLEKGHQVSISINYSDGSQVAREKLSAHANAIKIWRPNQCSLPSRVTRRLFRIITRRQSSNAQSYTWHLPSQADLVVITSPGNRFPESLVNELLVNSQKYALVIQSVSETQWPSDRELIPMENAYTNAECAFFVSKANLDSTQCQIAYELKRSAIVTNPIKVCREHLFRWPKKSEITEIAFVGRLDPDHKGLDLLFRALANPFWQHLPLRLNLYGEGASRLQLEKLAIYLNISHLVAFRGSESNVSLVWETNQLLVMPSRHEGMPLAVLEALMSGRPCLVTDVSGNAEYIDAGVNGFVATGPTVKCVGIALQSAWQQRDSWQKMGENAYSMIRKAIPVDPVETFTQCITKLV